MPTYEFMCDDCKKTFSVHVSVNEHEKEPQSKCENCDSKNVHQVFSGVSVITSKKS